jgi:hypothetical protein
MHTSNRLLLCPTKIPKTIHTLTFHLQTIPHIQFIQTQTHLKFHTQTYIVVDLMGQSTFFCRHIAIRTSGHTNSRFTTKRRVAPPNSDHHDAYSHDAYSRTTQGRKDDSEKPKQPTIIHP